MKRMSHIAQINTVEGKDPRILAGGTRYNLDVL